MSRRSENAPADPSPRLLSVTGVSLALLIGLAAQPEFPARLYEWLSFGWHMSISWF